MDILLIATTICFGLIIGSFLNVAILRLPDERITGRSHCPKCKKILQWFELVPLVSFLAQRGQCRSCGAKLSWQYPAIEAGTALLFLLALLSVQAAQQSLWMLPLLWFFLALLLVLGVQDGRWGFVLDELTLPGIAIAATANLVAGVPWASLALGIAVGFAFFSLQYYASGKRWVGNGDMRLGALAGAMLGWPLVLLAIAGAYILGSVVAVFLLATRRVRVGQSVPFGPFLTVAVAVALLASPWLKPWFASLLTFR